MKRLALAALLLLALCKPASATTCTTFYTWLTGDTITATRLNGNNSNLVTCGNAIDFNNIGTSGIKASNIKGTALGDNTFGFSTASATVSVPLLFGANAISFATAVGISNDNNGTVQGMLLNVPASSTLGFQFQVNGTTLDEIGAAGDLAVAPTINSTNTLGHVPPVYDITGADVGASMHIVEGTRATTVASTNCLNNTVCTLTGGSGTVTLTNSAVFADNLYRCFATNLAASANQLTFYMTKTSGSSVTFNVVNTSGVTINIGGAILFDFICIGK